MSLSDAQAFLLVVAALTLIECVAAVPRNGAVFVRRGSTRGWVIGTNDLMGSRSSGLHLANPLTPTQLRFHVPYVSISLGAEGVLHFSAQAFNPGPRLVGPGPFERFPDVTLPSIRAPRAARAWAERIESVAATRAGERDAAIERVIAEHTSATIAVARVIALEKATARLAPACVALQVFLLVALPVTVAFFGVAASWPWLLGAGLAIHLAVIVLAIRARRALAAEVSLLSVYLSPISAMRVRDLFSLDLLSDVHPLTAAVATLPKGAVRDFAARVLRDLTVPFDGGLELDSASMALESRFRRELTASLTKMLEARGLSADVPSSQPTTTDPGGRALCPRCGTGYAPTVPRCPDCGGLALVRPA